MFEAVGEQMERCVKGLLCNLWLAGPVAIHVHSRTIFLASYTFSQPTVRRQSLVTRVHHVVMSSVQPVFMRWLFVSPTWKAGECRAKTSRERNMLVKRWSVPSNARQGVSLVERYFWGQWKGTGTLDMGAKIGYFGDVTNS